MPFFFEQVAYTLSLSSTAYNEYILSSTQSMNKEKIKSHIASFNSKLIFKFLYIFHEFELQK